MSIKLIDVTGNVEQEYLLNTHSTTLWAKLGERANKIFDEQVYCINNIHQIVIEVAENAQAIFQLDSDTGECVSRDEAGGVAAHIGNMLEVHNPAFVEDIEALTALKKLYEDFRDCIEQRNIIIGRKKED